VLECSLNVPNRKDWSDAYHGLRRLAVPSNTGQVTLSSRVRNEPLWLCNGDCSNAGWMTILEQKW
jgi:hypothetical protein